MRKTGEKTGKYPDIITTKAAADDMDIPIKNSREMVKEAAGTEETTIKAENKCTGQGAAGLKGNRGCQGRKTKIQADCVTEVRIGNSVLVVSGYFKKDSKATAADKLAKVIEAEQRLLEREAI